MAEDARHLGFEKFVNEGAFVEVNAIDDPAGQVAKDHAVLADSKAVVTSEVVAQRVCIACLLGQPEYGALEIAPGLQTERRLECAYLLLDLNRVAQSSSAEAG